MPTYVRIVRRVNALIVEWFGMMGKSVATVVALTSHAYVLSLAHQFDPMGRKAEITLALTTRFNRRGWEHRRETWPSGRDRRLFYERLDQG